MQAEDLQEDQRPEQLVHRTHEGAQDAHQAQMECLRQHETDHAAEGDAQHRERDGLQQRVQRLLDATQGRGEQAEKQSSQLGQRIVGGDRQVRERQTGEGDQDEQPADLPALRMVKTG